jgi:uncharacterized membrane protein
MRALPVQPEPLWRTDLVSDPGSATTFAGAIAAAILAFVAVVFATTLVAIQLAASQYSPRTVRIFIRSRVTRVTLGLFLSTFVFSVVMLVSNRASVTSAKQFAPVVSVTTLLALTVATVFGRTPHRVASAAPGRPGSLRPPTCTVWSNCAGRRSAGSS